MNEDTRKILSAVCHGAIFFSTTFVSIGIPIAIFFISEDEVIKDNAKESLNFHLNVYIYAIIFGILIMVFVGIPLLILLAIMTWVLPIIAIIKVLENPARPYRYPFIFRLL